MLYFPQTVSFHTFIFFCSSYMFLINHALKFKYLQPVGWQLKWVTKKGQNTKHQGSCRSRLLYFCIFCPPGTGLLSRVLPRVFLPTIAGFHHEPGLEWPEVKTAAMLSHSPHHGGRRARYSSLQVCMNITLSAWQSWHLIKLYQGWGDFLFL